MTSIAVTLGGVAFRDFEIPEEIAFGGTQRLAVHQPVGGGRVIDVLGASAGEIAFEGVFSGPDAEQRVQLLDIARNTGAVLPLTWSGFAYMVVVAAFSACFQKSWWIPFEIRLVSVENLVTAIPSALAQAGLDIVSAAGFSALSGVSFDAVNSANAAGVTAAQADLASAVLGAGTTLAAATAAFSAGAGADGAIAVLGTLGGVSAMLAGAAAGQAYIGRAAVNLGRNQS